MTREEILEQVIGFAAIAFKKDAAEIKEDTDIAKELGVSSLQRITMSASIENEFDVTIPVARFGNFATIGDLTDYIMDEM